MRRRLVIKGLCSILLAHSLPCLAAPTQPVTVSGVQHSTAQSTVPNGRSPLSSTSFKLNLGSTAATAAAGQHLLGNSQSINILLGGTTMHVSAGTFLTPAERMAVMQVVQNGQQSLLLNASGAASGGALTIGPTLSSHLNSLSIPK